MAQCFESMIKMQYFGYYKITDWVRLAVISEGHLSNPLLKQDNLQPADHGHVQRGSEFLHGWRLHNVLGQPVYSITLE